MTTSKEKTEDVWNACCCGLKSFIQKRVDDPFAVEDILQEVFVKVHSKIDTLNDESKICSWVYQITRNTIVDHYRNNKNQTVDIDSMIIADDPDEADEPYDSKLHNSRSFIEEVEQEENVHAEIAMGLKDVINSLPHKYAEALTLVELEGVSQTELSARLGISISGAKSRVQRARQMLKDSLMQCCHFEFDKYGTIISSRPHSCCCCCN